MGMFGQKQDEIFYPNCRPIQGSSEGRVVLECQPKLNTNGKVLAGERPTQIVVEAGKQALIVDDGGNPDIILERLIAHIESKRLG